MVPHPPQSGGIKNRGIIPHPEGAGPATRWLNGAMARHFGRCRSKPCSVCGRWFTPDPRVGQRQRTCGRAGCRRQQKQRSQSSWAARNPDYWTERRLRDQAERLKQPEARLRGPPRELRQLPKDFAQDAMTTEAFVILLFLVRMQHRIAQDSMAVYLAGITGQSVKVLPESPQDETAAGGPSP